MGLYINNNDHPDVYMNGSDILEPNQGYFRVDYFSEMIKEQKELNKSLSNSFRDLKSLYHQQTNTQAGRWQEVGKQLEVLKESNLQHKNFENQAVQWLKTLDSNNAKLQDILENGGLLNKEIAEQVNRLGESNQAIVDQLGKYESSSQALASHMSELYDLNKQMSERISTQDDNQDQVINRLENQEALMEKTLRQIDQFRSILFERTNYIAESIENSYNLTSTYVYKLMTGSEQPLSLFMTKQREEERKSD
ncbi:hypothetical protein [Virgibacillus sp. L01]|uniref:hypothetical protein n=1 Tax=Virgibacillus sp. L01 TaxID=3457429 RepID=UPI003FD02D79